MHMYLVHIYLMQQSTLYSSYGHDFFLIYWLISMCKSSVYSITNVLIRFGHVELQIYELTMSNVHLQNIPTLSNVQLQNIPTLSNVQLQNIPTLSNVHLHQSPIRKESYLVSIWPLVYMKLHTLFQLSFSHQVLRNIGWNPWLAANKINIFTFSFIINNNNNTITRN